LGKLGSREMTATSDLDLILVYDFDEDDAASDGPKSLHAVQYYARLTQRLISALTVPTRRGGLYTVDMRLRPSGNKGPVATQLASFRQYQHGEAETWEHLALTRARVIAGDESLAATLRAAIVAVLARPRDIAVLAQDVRAMRQMIADVKGEGGDFDLKIAPGGLIDIEFIAQFLVLAHAHACPALLEPAPEAILVAAREAGLLADRAADVLIETHALLSSTIQLIATCLEGEFDAAAAPEGVRRRIAAAANLPDFSALERELVEGRASVRALFEEILAGTG
jgi:glutamate-ammonia-ligase adenylyltransferase